MSARTTSAERLGSPSPGRPASPVLVGRATELAQLREAVRRPPAVIAIEGEAGVGKTRLVQDWLAGPELAGAAHLIGHCSPLREPFPFGPVIDALTAAAQRLPDPDALSPVTGALRPLLPELADRLPAAPEPLRSRRQGRHRMFRGIRDLLASLGPAVLVLEDLHWADHGTQELLRFLADRPPAQLSFVLTYRREDLADPSVPALVPPLLPASGQLRLVLQPLDPAQVAELVSAVSHTEASPELVRQLHERTMGIPLAVEETLGLLGDRRTDLVRLPEQLDVPAALRDALLERASRLGRSARRLLHAAAVLDTPATESELVRVAGLAPQHATPGLAELVNRGLLAPVGDDRYGFRHRLAQQAVHDSLPEPVRRALHRRAFAVLTREAGIDAPDHHHPGGIDSHDYNHPTAIDTHDHNHPTAIDTHDHNHPTAIDTHDRDPGRPGSGRRGGTGADREPPAQPGQPAQLAQLARHCRAAGLVTEWLRYAEAAADQALALGDDDAAAELVRDVVAHPGATPETRVRLAIKLGRAALTGLGHGEAMAMLRRTLADPELPAEARGEVRLCLGVLLRNQGRRAREGWAELARAVTELHDRPGPAARAMASLGAPYLTDDQHLDVHLDWLARAAEAARRAGDPELAAVVEVNRATALLATGDPAGWELAGPVPDHPAHPVPTRAMTARPMLAVNLAWSATCIGRYPEAEALVRAGERMVAGAASSYLECALSGTALLLDYAVGNWDGLTARANEIVTTVSDVPSVVAEARLVLGLLALAGGDLREAEAHLAEATGSVPVAAAAGGGLARLAAATGDPVAAEQRVRRALALVRDKGVWCWAAELVPTAVAVLGRTPEHQPVARKLLDEVAAGVTGRDTPLAEAALVAGRALLAEADGQHLAAAGQHAEAASAYAELPRPYAATQAWEARGRCLLAAGQDGTGVLAEAAARYEGLGATWDVARCRHLLRTLGNPMPHRRGRRGYGRQLSPRERDVVRLVRTGLTNREVAEALFLSPRTVEAHVARALRKLGLPSRRVLASGPRPGTAWHPSVI